MTERKHISVIYTMAGGGHLKAAESLKEVLESTGRYRATLVNPYVELMPHLDLWKRITKRTSEDIYNQTIIGEGKTGLFCLTYYAGILLNFKLAYKEGRQRLGDYFKAQKPDMVISVLPMLNRVIFDAVEDYRQTTGTPQSIKGAVLITDWTEFGQHIWFPKGRDYHAICGTDESFKKASAYKNLAGRVHPTQGILLMPSFQDNSAALDKQAAKQALGLDPAMPVICMLYGGQGSWRMKELVETMIAKPMQAQLLLLCGRNAALADTLRNMDIPFPHQIVGFTNEVAKYLGASDIFVGKPGPGSVSEALHFGQRMLLDRTMALPQEMPVLKWVVKHGAGSAFKSRNSFLNALAGLLDKTNRNQDPVKPRPNTASRQITSLIDGIFSSPDV
ncbi:hypothetical protein TH19_20515 [Thalassospira profundimaris]|uniref:Glycosyl transferase family 28 C-terminal domain-containing protein n=2 Tax=Thalassospira TaxID=168934 RepID=A0A367VZG6_9PROT|nr:glycosyltransferase [Thalassospira profundimaris]RCK31803.1 hypothetical protein TH19_20515 [Thalassospira profundimaris]